MSIIKKYEMISILIASLLLLSLPLCVQCALKCSLQVGQQENRINCMNSLFSPEEFQILQKQAFFHWDDLCASELPIFNKDSIAITNRGKCTFEVKARMAQQLGYSGLLVVNNNNTIFPMGPSDVNYKSKISILMVAESFLTTIHYNSLKESTTDLSVPLQIPELTFSMIKERDTTTNTMQNTPNSSHSTSANDDIVTISRWSTLIMTIIAVCTIFLYCFSKIFSSSQCNAPISSSDAVEKSSTSTVRMLLIRCCTMSLLLGFFGLVRIATFRKTAIRSPSNQSNSYFGDYNHRETDEQIFEALVRSVSNRLDAYALTPEFIRSYQLAEDNYAFPFFHHPPAFVYFSAACYHACHLPLPSIPLLQQAISMLSIMGIGYEMHQLLHATTTPLQRSDKQWWSVSVLAALLWCICPIAVWCSQKFWIDNMACMSSTLGIWLHFYLLRSSLSRPSYYTCLVMFASGLIGFGGLILNSKITSFALLPFFLGSIVWKQVSDTYQHILNGTIRKKTDDENTPSSTVSMVSVLLSALWKGAVQCVCFLLGTALGQWPWLYWYHSATGRWIPSAWPSAAMLERFPYVQAAVNKPWYTYFLTIIQIAPLQSIGFLLDIALLCTAIYALYAYLHSHHSGHTTLEYDTATNHWQKILWLTIFALWPLSFLFGLTLLGCLGSGYQTRFLLPALPATCLLTSFFIHWLWEHVTCHDLRILCACIVLVAGCIQCFMVLYYGIMYAPFYADVEVHVVDIQQSILTSPYHMATTRESVKDIQLFMKHFGFPLK